MESRYGIVVNGDKVLSLSVCVGNTVSPLFLPTSSELTYDQCVGMIHELARKTPNTAEDSQKSVQHLKAKILQALWNGENDHLTMKEFRLKYPEFEALSAVE